MPCRHSRRPFSKRSDLTDAVVVTGEEAAADRCLPASDRRARSAVALAGHRQPRGPIPPDLVSARRHRRVLREARLGPGKAAGGAQPPGDAAAGHRGGGASRQSSGKSRSPCCCRIRRSIPAGPGRRRAAASCRSAAMQSAALGASRPGGALAGRQCPRGASPLGGQRQRRSQPRSPWSDNSKAAAFGCSSVNVETGDCRSIRLELGGARTRRRLWARRHAVRRLLRLRRSVRAARLGGVCSY